MEDQPHLVDMFNAPVYLTAGDEGPNRERRPRAVNYSQCSTLTPGHCTYCTGHFRYLVERERKGVEQGRISKQERDPRRSVQGPAANYTGGRDRETSATWLSMISPVLLTFWLSPIKRRRLSWLSSVASCCGCFSVFRCIAIPDTESFLSVFVLMLTAC